MPVEVYSTVKPASNLRAWASSGLLLILAGALAASMSRNGSGGGGLGGQIEPRGWDIAFRPPAMFREVDSLPEHFSSTYRFQDVGPESGAAELVFWRLRAGSGETPLTVCREVLDSAESWTTILFGPPRTRSAAPIGDREGLEVHNPAIPMIVRSVVLENGWAYAVSMRLRGAPFDEPLYRLFDLTCRMVRFKSGDGVKGTRA